MSSPTNPKHNDHPPNPTLFDKTSYTPSQPSTYPLSLKLSPVLIPLLAITIALFFPSLTPSLSSHSPSDPPTTEENECVADFNYANVNVTAVLAHARAGAVLSWEIGVTAAAILEFTHPERSVFASTPFPGGKVPHAGTGGDFLKEKVKLGDGETIMEDGFSGTDPASLGIVATMLGGRWFEAAGRQVDFLLRRARRWGNGAVSHRVERAEVWSDAVAMFPPFLAYYGVATTDLEIVREAVGQVGLLRDVLVFTEGEGKGLWRHVVGGEGSEMLDPGAWGTGNAWAVWGMLRVRATIAGWEGSREVLAPEVEKLDAWILETLSAVMKVDNDESGLLRNYLASATPWYGDVAGTALLAAAAYRMGTVMEASWDQTVLLAWAARKRRVVWEHVSPDGVAAPVVNPYAHDAEMAFEGVSPEGQAFVVVLAAAWRDCVCAGVCGEDEREE